jgi:DNA-binding transcriptional LysR family regulator
MLDAHQLNVFMTAARTLNFTAAARQLHMTQPSVSQHIQALEQHFDMVLFVRSGRHLRLTDAGEALLPMAEKLVAQSHNIENRMEQLKGDVYGRLMVGCSTTLGKYILPLLLAEFMRMYPKVEASCMVMPRETAVQKLCDGDVHVALASEREMCGELRFERFMADKVLLIAPMNHPWASREWIEPEELLEARFIWREATSGTRQVAERALHEVDILVDHLQTVLTLGNSEAIALAVQEGIGVGFVSQIIVSRLVVDRVAVVRVRGLDICQHIYVGCHGDRVGTAAQNAFWEFLTDPHNPVLRRMHYSDSSRRDGFAFTAVSDTESSL